MQGCTVRANFGSPAYFTYEYAGRRVQYVLYAQVKRCGCRWWCCGIRNTAFASHGVTAARRAEGTQLLPLHTSKPSRRFQTPVLLPEPHLPGHPLLPSPSIPTSALPLQAWCQHLSTERSTSATLFACLTTQAPRMCFLPWLPAYISRHIARHLRGRPVLTAVLQPAHPIQDQSQSYRESTQHEYTCVKQSKPFNSGA